MSIELLQHAAALSGESLGILSLILFRTIEPLKCTFHLLFLIYFRVNNLKESVMLFLFCAFLKSGQDLLQGKKYLVSTSSISI